jgi:hypothetical protein
MYVVDPSVSCKLLSRCIALCSLIVRSVFPVYLPWNCSAGCGTGPIMPQGLAPWKPTWKASRFIPCDILRFRSRLSTATRTAVTRRFSVTIKHFAHVQSFHWHCLLWPRTLAKILWERHLAHCGTRRCRLLGMLDLKLFQWSRLNPYKTYTYIHTYILFIEN